MSSLLAAAAQDSAGGGGLAAVAELGAAAEGADPGFHAIAALASADAAAAAADPAPAAAATPPQPGRAAAAPGWGGGAWELPAAEQIQVRARPQRAVLEARRAERQAERERLRHEREALRCAAARRRPVSAAAVRPPLDDSLQLLREEASLRREEQRRHRVSAELCDAHGAHREFMADMRRRKHVRSLQLSHAREVRAATRGLGRAVREEEEARGELCFGRMSSHAKLLRREFRARRNLEQELIARRRAALYRRLRRARIDRGNAAREGLLMAAHGAFSERLNADWRRLAAEEAEARAAAFGGCARLVDAEWSGRLRIVCGLPETAECSTRRVILGAEAREWEYLMTKERSEALDGVRRAQCSLAAAIAKRRRLAALRDRRNSIFRICGRGVPPEGLDGQLQRQLQWHAEELGRLEALQRKDGYSVERELTILGVRRKGLRLALAE